MKNNIQTILTVCALVALWFYIVNVDSNDTNDDNVIDAITTSHINYNNTIEHDISSLNDIKVFCSYNYNSHYKHSHTTYEVCYLGDYGIPEYVKYTLTKEDAILSENRSNRHDKFHQCEFIMNTANVSATPNDYTKSGYDRGHMCPNNDRDYNDNTAFETFSMCNICPQTHALNAGIWKTTEEYGHKLAKEYGEITIITGPIISTDGNKIKNRIIIPTAFFKIYIANNQIIESVIIPNNENGLKKSVKYYHVDIQEIKFKTGLEFII